MKRYLPFLVFSGLNAVLWRRGVIPGRDIVMSVLTLLLAVIAVMVPTQSQVVYKETPAFNKSKRMLALSELTFFLVIPWALLIKFRGDDDMLFDYILGSHLYIIQTQIVQEAIVKPRKGVYFWFIVVTNLYRGVGIGTWIRRYLEVREELISTHDAMTTGFFMDTFTILATMVWLASNAFILFLWYPSVTTDFSGSNGGLRTYKGAVAIVTGASSGIGRALVEELADLGVQVIVLADRQVALAEELAAELRAKSNVEVKVYGVDVRNFEQVKRMVNETKKTYGRLDYLFNNAGILVIGPIETIGVENFDYIFDVNVRGVHHGVQAAYPIMKEQGYGHIVNTSSLLGLIPSGTWGVAYSASKHAVVGLSTNLRIEAAKFGVRVSAFCPGFIDTPIHKDCGQYGENLTGIPKEAFNAMLAKAHFMGAKQCAQKTLLSVAKNEPIIVVPSLPSMKSRLLYRLSPSLWLHNHLKSSERKKKKMEKIGAAPGKAKAE